MFLKLLEEKLNIPICKKYVLKIQFSIEKTLNLFNFFEFNNMKLKEYSVYNKTYSTKLLFFK